MRGSLVAVAVFLVVALVGAGLALVQRGRAERSATVALSQNLGAKGVAEPQLDTALLLAEEGLNLDNSIQTQGDLLSTLLHSPSAIAVLHGGTARAAPQALAVSPDGLTLAVVDGVDTFRSRHDDPLGDRTACPQRGERRWILTLHPTAPSLRSFGAGGSDLIDVRTQEVVRRIGVGLGVDESAEDNVWSPVLLSRDGRGCT